MSRTSEHRRRERVLICAPFGRDAALIQRELTAAGLDAEIFDTIEALSSAINEGGGVALLADEALPPQAVRRLAEELKSQPPWSDFPVLVMTSGGGTTDASRFRLSLLGPLGNISLLERPLRIATLLSSLHAALRARRHQYQLAEHLEERKAIERELSRRNEELIRKNRELEEFSYVASHDLQEPLRMVNIYTQLIVKRFMPEDHAAEQYAEFIQKGVARMEKLLRDLLTFSRTIHADNTPAATADLSKSLSQALTTLNGRIEETRARITCDPLPVVSGDEAQFAQVFQNLISNALKYRKADVVPEIRISTERRDNDWIIAVSDNGIGFEQQYSEHIFRLFKRLHKEEYPGTGVGLAICRRIVERFGGQLRAVSAPQEGTTFYMSLRSIEGQQ